MKVVINRKLVLSIIVVVLIFWIIDFVLHYTGVGESNFYYFSKFANALIFSFIWFGMFNSKSHWKKLFFAVVFGTWVSFYYLISSYSGFVQIFGVYARNTPPPFVIFGKFFTPIIWWFVHIFAFYLGLETTGLLYNKK